MGIESYITDPSCHRKAHISTLDDKDSRNGLIVATDPLRKYVNQGKIFLSSTYGIDMNIGITIDYTEDVHDGEDSVYWTASVISGAKWTTNSTDQAHAGTQSIKYDNGNIGDILQILNSSILDLASYDTLSLWIYVSSNWDSGDSIEIYGWDSSAGTIVGNSIKLENYFSWFSFNTWHKVSVPIEDMGLTNLTLDAIRIEIINKDVQSPTMYIDDIQFTGISGQAGSGIFSITPDLSTWYHVNSIRFVLADDITGITTVAGNTENATMPNLSYNKLLGLNSLDNGIVYQRLTYGEIQSTFTLHHLSDMLSTPGTTFQATSDGTNTLLIVELPFTQPLILRAEERDELRIIINDNLSGLLLFRTYASGWKENRI